jgi:hypothetical protein
MQSVQVDAPVARIQFSSARSAGPCAPCCLPRSGASQKKMRHIYQNQLQSRQQTCTSNTCKLQPHGKMDRDKDYPRATSSFSIYAPHILLRGRISPMHTHLQATHNQLGMETMALHHSCMVSCRHCRTAVGGLLDRGCTQV